MMLVMHAPRITDAAEYQRHQQRHEQNGRSLPHIHQSTTLRSRSAFPITGTDLNVMAALAIIGLSNTPNHG
jgi:hypothetical protein